MIYIGLTDSEKSSVITDYRNRHNIKKIVVLYPEKFTPTFCYADDRITYKDIIEYVPFYRLLQEINKHTLIVINECLRTQNRYDLTYNCIRHYLRQTDHVLVFQKLPQIDTRDDFMVLFDFVTQSRWKSRKFDINLILDNTRISIKKTLIKFQVISVFTTSKTQERYKEARSLLFENLGTQDPHIIPRRLYLLGGNDKRIYIDALKLPMFACNNMYVARNQRLNRDNIITYKNAVRAHIPLTVLEFPHRFINFIDMITIIDQTRFDVLVTDLKVDSWYLSRYIEWSKRINETCTSLQE